MNPLLWRSISAVLILLQLLTSWQVSAADPGPFKKPVLKIPSTFSAPPSLSPPEIRDYFRCEREFTLGGKKYQCDSYGRADAEKFRLAIESVPEAAHEIEIYQQRRYSDRTIAYLISAGFFAIILGVLTSAVVRRSNPHTGQLIRDTTLLGGIWFSGMSLMYGLSSKWDNDRHLETAAQLYNKSHPDQPVELQLKIDLP